MLSYFDREAIRLKKLVKSIIRQGHFEITNNEHELKSNEKDTFVHCSNDRKQ